VLWGIWHGAFLVLERAGLEAALAKTPSPLRHLYALAIVVGGWVLFRCETLAHAGAFYVALAGFGAASLQKYPLRMFADNLVVLTLAVAVIGSMPVGRRLFASIDRVAMSRRWLPRLAAGGEWLSLAAVVFGACAYLAAGTYNPFIYFRF
jgi:alginate O-acetyltransferase complex protein AlgI